MACADDSNHQGQKPMAARIDDFELIPPLPMKLSRGYRAPHPNAPIDPCTGTKHRVGDIYLPDHWSIPTQGRYYLFESVTDLLTDFYFRAGHNIIDFAGHDVGGNLPKFRALACMAWLPPDPDGWEKLFIGKYTGTILEAVEFLRPFQELAIDYLSPQGFGIHRYNPAENTYMFDEDLNEEIEESLKMPTFVSTNDVEKTTFISSSSKDYGVAKAVYSRLHRCRVPAFCAPVSLLAGGSTEFSTAIDRAIESSYSLIVIASDKECFNSPWFDQEWRTWVNERRSGRKSGNILVLTGDSLQVGDLPVALRFFETRRFAEFDDETVRSYFC
jgi:hypothetical protein